MDFRDLRDFRRIRAPLMAPVLRGVHWGVHRLLPLAGYKFEERRSGELKIGLWRKTLGPVKKKSLASAKRFVLVPGFGDTPLSWLPVVALLLPLLKREYDEVVLIDFPGFYGGLRREKSFHSMDLLMEKLYDVFDSLAPRALLGHSLGGWLVGRYAGLCGSGARPLAQKGDESGLKPRARPYAGPETIILADPSGAFGDETQKVEWRERFDKVIKEGFHHLRPHVFAREPMWMRFLASEFVNFVKSEEIAQFIASVRDDHLVEAVLPHVKARVWLLWGELDTLTPPTFAPGWLGKLPPEADAQAVLIVKSGHSPQLERPGLTAAVIAQMLHPRAQGLLKHEKAKRFWRVMENGETPETTASPLSAGE